MDNQPLDLDIPTLEFGLQIFNVHAFFVLFLSSIGFDSTVLIDFITSPETNFNIFFVSYLEICCMEKKMSRNFNYDLPSACAELDIVDEYLDTSEFESDGESNQETSVNTSSYRLDGIQTNTVLGRSVTTEQRMTTERQNDYSPREDLGNSVGPYQIKELDKSLDCEVHAVQHKQTVLDSIESDPLITKDDSRENPLSNLGMESKTMQVSQSAERESINEIGAPLSKRQRLSLDHVPLDEQSDTFVSCSENYQEISSKCDVPLVPVAKQPNSSETVANYQSGKSSPNIQCTSVIVGRTELNRSAHFGGNSPIAGETSEICKGDSPIAGETSEIFKGDSPMSGPPVETLCRVLQCFTEVKNLLCRLGDKDLLSVKQNNIILIISCIDTLGELYFELLHWT